MFGVRFGTVARRSPRGDPGAVTSPYTWNPMPHALDVVCPACGGPATFAFATAVRVARNADLPALQEVHGLRIDHWTQEGRRFPVAVFQPGLHGPAELALRGLPEGYAAGQWGTPRYLVHAHPTLGAVRCPGCHLRREHHLRWPTDAWFAVRWRQHLLWAWHREAAWELREWLASHDRRLEGRRWQGMLMKVPGALTTAKARLRVVALLDRLLAG